MKIKIKLNNTAATINLSSQILADSFFKSIPAIFILIVGLAHIFVPAAAHQVILVSLTLWLGLFTFLSLKYKNVAVDPKSFISVLIFASVSISVGISVYLFTSVSSLNTFGTYPVHYLGGAHLLAMVGLYYLSYWVGSGNNYSLLNRVVIFLALVATIANIFNIGVLFINLSIIILGLIYVIKAFVNNNKNIFLPLSLIIFLSGFLINKANTPVLNLGLVTIYIGIALYLIYKLNLKTIKATFSHDFAQLKTWFTNFPNGNITNLQLKITNTALSFVVVVVSLIVVLATNLSKLGGAVNSLVQDYTQIISSIKPDATYQLIIGAGASKISTTISAVNFDALVPIVFKFTGILGLLTLVLFGSFVIWKLYKSKTKSYLDYVALFLVPVLSFVFVPSYYLLVLWWLQLGMLDNQGVVQPNWQKRKVKSKKALGAFIYFAPYILSVGFVAGLIFVISKIPL